MNMTKQRKSRKNEVMPYLIKANTELIDTATSMQELKDKTNAYERTIQGSPYKKEYCIYNESDGRHFGYHFTLF